MKLEVNEKIHKALSPAHLKQPIQESDLKDFIHKLKGYLNHIDDNESEENFKGHLKDLIAQTCPDNMIETQERIDLIIRKSKNKTENAVVLFEAKRSKNIADMVTHDNLNKKAFHELILYFMRERKRGNTDIKTLVICTQKKFYFFDAKDFEHSFFKDTKFRKEFEAYDNNEKTDSKTDFFYNDIAKPFIEANEATLKAHYLDLSYFEQILDNQDEKAQKKLIHLFKMLSPEFLLKKPVKADNNTLNKDFYNELLYIMGLTETKESGKKVITRFPHKQRNENSLIENTIFKIMQKRKFNDPEIREQYGIKEEERAFNIALQLVLIWINRLLFLKLLEGQIYSYNGNQKDYKFLNASCFDDYDALSNLFFALLATPLNKRSDALKERFSFIPYLNSSLFEETDLEESFSIGMLDNKELPLYSKTVLKEYDKKELKTLDYIYDFLDAYDFTNENEDEIQKQSKTIINASVLGLIFEKINGYKDGSIFTPSYITMFMSKQVIEKAVLQKFNDKYELSCENIEELENYLSKDSYKQGKILEYNEVINSVKICDPAVGSGHFLVSCLNEIIHLKSRLGILADKDGKRITGYEIALDNDEIIITNEDTGELYQYRTNNYFVADKIQHIQKTIFNEKQTIIENCLFGIDINPNSVNICRLRLWIELLKNAYYTQETGFKELETLPNIDINIKCGDALLSRFRLDEPLSNAFKSRGLKVSDYKKMVSDYKNTKDKSIKYDLESKIADIKSYFRKEYTANLDKDINKKLFEIKALETQSDLFGEDIKALKERQKNILSLKADIERLENLKKIYEHNKTFVNAFEWRFEFPEILDDEGKFLGFDIIIGNPPYIQMQDDKGKLADLYKNRRYKTFTRTGDIYMLFYEKGYEVLRPQGIECLITSNKWMRAGYGEVLRQYFTELTKPYLLIDLGSNVFENATVDTNMLFISKPIDKQKAEYINATSLHNQKIASSIMLDNLVKEASNEIPISKEQWIIQSIEELRIATKLKQVGKPLEKWDIEINYGIKTGYNEAFIIDTEIKEKLCQADPKSIEIIKPILRGKDIKKWKADWQGLWLINSHNGYKGIPAVDVKNEYPIIYKHLLEHEQKASKRFDKGQHWTNLRNCVYVDNFKEEKIVYPEITSKLNFLYDENAYFCNNKCFILTGKSLKFLVAVLNSSLSVYWIKNNCAELGEGFELRYIFMKNLPIPNISEKEKAPFIDLTNQILFLTDSSDYNASLEKQTAVKALQGKIDRLVYDVYGLTNEEIAIIEGSI